MYRVNQVDIVDKDGKPIQNNVPLSMNLEDIFYTFITKNGEPVSRSLKDILFGNIEQNTVTGKYEYRGYFEPDFNTTSLWKFLTDHQEWLKIKINEIYGYWVNLPHEEYQNFNTTGIQIATAYDILNTIQFYQDQGGN